MDNKRLIQEKAVTRFAKVIKSELIANAMKNIQGAKHPTMQSAQTELRRLVLIAETSETENSEQICKFISDMSVEDFEKYYFQYKVFEMEECISMYTISLHTNFLYNILAHKFFIQYPYTQI